MPTIFVYGARMLHPWVCAHGVAACVDDHAIRFVVRGVPALEPAFAALTPEPGARAWGVVAEWPEAIWSPIRRLERPYEERPVVAIRRDGARVDAQALFLARAPRSAEGRPSARYADLLLRAAERFGFPEETVARYRALRDGGPRLTLAAAESLARIGLWRRPG
jgi:hypothetical protein